MSAWEQNNFILNSLYDIMMSKDDTPGVTNKIGRNTGRDSFEIEDDDFYYDDLECDRLMEERWENGR